MEFSQICTDQLNASHAEWKLEVERVKSASMYPAEMDDLRRKINELQTETKVSKDRHLALAAIDESQRKEMADQIKNMEVETLQLVSKFAVRLMVSRPPWMADQ